MRLLLTSDWQADINNLSECEIALKELIAYADKYKPDAIVHAGDSKEKYDQVPLRVVKFWVRAVRTIKATGHRLLINLGNHDRLSQSPASKNWLDILRSAGAETFSKPTTIALGVYKRIGTLCFLPYTSDRKLELEWANLFNPDGWDTPRVLIFHTGVQDQGLSGGMWDGIQPHELHAEDYIACFGGHDHHYQKSGNIWYVGSPFTMDWSEANQKKGYVLADIEEGKEPKVRQLPTNIPGWYDTEYLETRPLGMTDEFVEDNAIIRSTIEVNSKKITQQIKDEEKRLRDLYGSKVRLFVRPKVLQDNKTDIIIDGKTDEQKVAQYVQATIKDSRFSPKRAIKYLVNCLQQCGVAQAGQQLTFLSVEAKNWLSFKHIKIKFTKQGLVLLKGRNRDVPGRSNGAGKSNLLGLLPSIMFGETLKEQKNDELAFEHNDNLSWGRLRLRNGAGQIVEIYRQRRPHAIYLRVNGKDVSSGITGKGKNETQGLITQYTGFDLHLLRNSVYIDQTTVNTFIFGGQKDRMDLINKLENLERFDAALAVAKKDTKSTEELITNTTSEVSHLENNIERIQNDLKELKTFQFDRALKTKLAAKKRDLETAIYKYNKLKRVKLEEPSEDGLNDLTADLAQAEGNVQYLKRELSRVESLKKAKKCPLCKQPVGKVGSKAIERARVTLGTATLKLAGCQQAVNREKELIEQQWKKYDKFKAEVNQNAIAVRQLRDHVELLREQYHTQKKQQAVIESKRQKLEKELSSSKEELKIANDTLIVMDVKMELLQYSQKALNRGGMPLYLSVSLCPLLNKAAQDYSTEFSDGSIQVLFDVVDGQFVPTVANTTGSQTTKGQSDGESAMVGLIAAFALREAAPKTNLLVIDEPGRGLDPVAAKQFAVGLSRIRNRWPTIIVTTHNEVISGILSDAKHWTVVKKNKVSRLIQ